jgi:hypothetical protein
VRLHYQRHSEAIKAKKKRHYAENAEAIKKRMRDNRAAKKAASNHATENAA